MAITPQEDSPEDSAPDPPLPALPVDALNAMTNYMVANGVGRLDLRIEAAEVDESQLRALPPQTMVLSPELREDEQPSTFGLSGVFVVWSDGD